MSEQIDFYQEVGLDDVVIVGNGISAFALARRLSQEADIPSTVVAPHTPTFADQDLPMETRASIPIVKRSILEQLQIPLDGYTSISKKTISVERPLNPVRQLGLSYTRRRVDPKLARYFLDIEDVKRRMYEASMDDPNITVTPGRLTDVEVYNRRIASITIDGEGTLRPQVVIDATGGQARVAEKVNAKEDNLIFEKQVSQPSTLIGGFVTLDRAALAEHPFLEDETRISFLNGSLVSIIAPADKISGSSATHVFFIEGNDTTVRAAFQAAREAMGGHPSRQKQYIETLKLLTKGTAHEHILDHAEHIDRTVHHHFKKATRRHVQAEGMNLGLVGDAHVQVNPVTATGFRSIAQDIDLLVDCLSSSSSLAEGLSRYNQTSEERAKAKIREAQKMYLVIGGLYRFFGIT